MPKFPEPPPRSDLVRLGPQLRWLPVGTELWRVYFRGGNHPQVWSGFRSFGPVRTARFDHHLLPPHEQDRGILYCAADAQTCLAEVYQETRVIDTAGREPWLVGFALTAELALLDLSGNWPTIAGASMAINSGLRPRSRRWSQAIYQAYPGVHGLWYCSSMNANRPALALYERAEQALPPTPFFHRALADPLLLTPLRNVAFRLGYLIA